MRGELHPALVCFLDRCAKLGARDVHVCFERSRALVCPEVDHPSRVGDIGQLVYLVETKSFAFEIRCGGIDPRTRLSAGVDVALNADVAEAIEIAAGAHRGYATRQVQSRKALSDVAVHARTGRVEEMLVHHDQTGYDRFPGEVDDERTTR